MTEERLAEIRRDVRERIAYEIQEDIDGGESLMKEVFETLKNDAEMAACISEMQRIVAWLKGS